jgi:O-antigen ligase
MQLNYNLKNLIVIFTTMSVAAFLFFIHPVLLLLMVLLTLLVIGALLKPQYFLYALIFFFPWIGWSWTYAITPDSFLGQFVGLGVIELPIADIVGILALSVWGINVLVRYFYQNDKTWKPQFPGWIFIVILFISGILALQNADVWYLSSIKYLLRPILFAYVAFFLPVYNLARRRADYQNIFYVALAVSVTGVLMGAWSFLGVFEHIHRAHPIALFGYPFWGLNQNLLGELLIALLPIGIALFLLEKRGAWRAGYLSIFLLMILITLLTFSRTAWLALLMMAMLGIYWLRQYLSKEFFAGVAVAVLLALPLAAYMINYSFNTYTAQSSNWGRWEMTQFAYFLWQEQPLIGNGAGTYFYRLEKTPMYTEHLGTAFDAHGLLQKIGSEQGLLGLFAYLGFFGYLGWRLWQAYRQVTDKNPKIILVCSMLILIGSVFYQGFNTNYYSAKLWVPAAIAFLAIKYYNQEKV